MRQSEMTSTRQYSSFEDLVERVLRRSQERGASLTREQAEQLAREIIRYDSSTQEERDRDDAETAAVWELQHGTRVPR